jgi:ribosomal protein L5
MKEGAIFQTAPSVFYSITGSTPTIDKESKNLISFQIRKSRIQQIQSHQLPIK